MQVARELRIAERLTALPPALGMAGMQAPLGGLRLLE